jgi:hypothetical protein
MTGKIIPAVGNGLNNCVATTTKTCSLPPKGYLGSYNIVVDTKTTKSYGVSYYTYLAANNQVSMNDIIPGNLYVAANSSWADSIMNGSYNIFFYSKDTTGTDYVIQNYTILNDNPGGSGPMNTFVLKNADGSSSITFNASITSGVYNTLLKNGVKDYSTGRFGYTMYNIKIVSSLGTPQLNQPYTITYSDYNPYVPSAPAPAAAPAAAPATAPAAVAPPTFRGCVLGSINNGSIGTYMLKDATKTAGDNCKDILLIINQYSNLPTTWETVLYTKSFSLSLMDLNGNMIMTPANIQNIQNELQNAIQSKRNYSLQTYYSIQNATSYVIFTATLAGMKQNMTIPFYNLTILSTSGIPQLDQPYTMSYGIYDPNSLV